MKKNNNRFFFRLLSFFNPKINPLNIVLLAFAVVILAFFIGFYGMNAS